MSFWCYVVIGLVFFLISCGIPTLGQSNNNLAGFKTWTRSSDSLPIATREPNVVYDVSFDPNTIWIVGMLQCTTCVLKYDINNDSIVSYYTLNNGGWSYGNPSVVFINGIVYYIHNDGVLYSYNVITNAETTVTTFSALRPCLTKHPNGGQLYVANGDGNEFYVYTFASGTGGFISGPSMKYSRTYPTCVINDYTGITYLYIIGGDSSYIERIDINSLNQWETLTTRLTNEIEGDFDFDSSQIRHMAPISYLNYIILLGGWDGNSEDDMLALNVVTLDITYLGTYPEYYHGAGAVLAHNRIYSFAGYQTQTSSVSNDIIYTNEQIPPTLNPSNQPSLTPTNNPTTLFPSYNPSIDPSTIPSALPTVTGTDMPSKILTSIPTSNPSIYITPQTSSSSIVTTTPADFPTDPPTDLDTTGPTPDPTSSPTSDPTGVPLAVDAPTISQNTPSPSETSGGAVIVKDTTNTPERDESNNNNNNNDNNNSNDLETVEIIIVSVSVAVSVCCIIVFCIFGITILYCSKQQSLNREITIKQLAANNNSERVPLQNGNILGHMGTMAPMGSMGYMNTLNTLPNQPQVNKLLSTSMAGSDINNAGESGLDGDVGSDLNEENNNNRNVIKKRDQMMELVENINVRKNGGRRKDNDDELYVLSDSDGADGFDGNGNDNDNNKVVQIDIDGKILQIDHKDLINIVNVKGMNGVDGNTSDVAGENVNDEIQD